MDLPNHHDLPPVLLPGGPFTRCWLAADWGRSPLGLPTGWSPALQGITSTLLAARAQIVLFWGAQYVALYNEVYAPSIGQKHPHALGRPAKEYWAELWDDLEPLLRGVRETGQTFEARDRPFYIERHGYGETVYFDVSYSAVREADGTVGGVLCIVNETTGKVASQRMQAFLLGLADALRAHADPGRLQRVALGRLREHLQAEAVLWWVAASDGQPLRLEQGVGVPGQPLAAIATATLQALGKGLSQVQRTEHATVLRVPVLCDGQLAMVLAVHFERPRRLHADEITTVEQTARWAWLAVGQARAEQALRAQSRRLLDLNDTLEARVAATVAERESALAQLHEARKMETVGQLTGGIAHDFNNLLTPIMGSLDLIRRRVPDPTLVRLIDGAQQSAARAKHLVSGLLSFARRQALRPCAVDLSRLIEEMRELLERSLGPSIEVAYFSEAKLPLVVVDPHQLELALLNLAVNARDAMPAGGRLVMRASACRVDLDPAGVLAPGRYVQLEVADSGQGMDAQTLERCTEPFYSTKEVGKGTGLGLSMVHGLALQSGGSLRLESAPGHGTRAMIVLPATEAFERVLPSSESGPGSAVVAPCKACVLLVDDERWVRQTTGLLLRELGYQVVEADSSADALGRVRSGLRPDVLVADYLMPGKNGLQLADELGTLQPGLPCLIISGFADLDPALVAGHHWLSKPFDQVLLGERVAALLQAG